MNTFRSEFVGLADELRLELVVQEFGLRLDTVRTLTRVWSGGSPGRGIEMDTYLDITPLPRVSAPPRYSGNSGGRYEEGDVRLNRISATYTIEQLTGGERGSDTEFYWEINGELYRVVGEPEEKYLGWQTHLRRINRKRVK